MRRAFFLGLLAVAACASPLAQINLAGIRLDDVSDTDNHLVVEVDVRATESGGSNIGQYCVEVTFSTQPNLQRFCADDLTDGDLRTVRIVSDTKIPRGTSILVAARLATYISSETLFAP